MATPIRFWIEFEIDREARRDGTVVIDDRRSALLAGGCGVTAWDLDDALELIAAAFAWWSDEPLPAVAQVIREVDVSTLPERAWVHGMGVVVWRGVWSPPMNNYVPPTR